ncbi:hypothetical protein TWF730_009077 [Orbilia blumenaviensis]|uniref:Protein kinase domain-containing protein n=1 Tax=Orbilia blumenaviensis TaxID=1796055 RepID=A0AAV9V3U6_9PEZI
MAWKLHTVNQGKACSTLFALLYNGPTKLIAAIPKKNYTPKSLENRIIETFSSPQTTAAELASQRKRGTEYLLEAIKIAEDKNYFHKTNLQADSVLYISSENEAFHADLVQESKSYSAFCKLLKPKDSIVQSNNQSNHVALKNKTVSYEEVVYESPLPSWRMTSTKASIASAPDEKFVFKGTSFYQFLVCGEDGFQREIEACYREISMVNHLLLRHPNIIPPAEYLVSVNPVEGGHEEKLICGSLYTFYGKGSLADILDKTVDEGIRLPLNLKAKWCYQLCSAMAHVHFKAKCWHQDLKAPNVILDDDDNVLIVDWEQCGANPFIVAPEADGFSEVHELDVEVNGRRQLEYTRYEGPERYNEPYSDSGWNVFPEWNTKYPRASELAEVYSLGKTMWVLLEQVGLENQPGVTDYSTQTVHWSSASEDIPESWKHMIQLSIADDPNDRPLMADLLKFWEKQWQSFN